MSDTRPSFNTQGSTVWAVNEIVQYLKPHMVGGIREIDKVSIVERHLGRFDKPEDITNFMSARDGGIRIAAMRVSSYESIANRLVGNVHFAAYIFAGDQFGYEKDIRAEVITGRLVKALSISSALPTAYGSVSGLRSDNLYSGSIDKLGIAIWSVTWSQQWYLDVPLDLNSLDDFRTFGFKGEIKDGTPSIEGDVSLPQQEKGVFNG